MTPNSGAGRIKGDIAKGPVLVDTKDARKSFTLRSDDLLKHYRDAMRGGYDEAEVWVYFNHNHIRARIIIVPDMRTPV